MYASIDTIPATITLDTFSSAGTLVAERTPLHVGEPEIDEVHEAPVTLRTPQARCADGHGTLTHLFFSDDVIDIARAKAICSKCQLTATCLDGALDRAEPWGVWGGELLDNGRIVVHKRPRGRPPKHPRPVLIVDEVPIPPHLVA